VEELAAVPAPQLRALEVALLRAEPGGARAESGAIAFGFLNSLRALADHDALLVAVDDVQWLDSPSADALAFAARRLEESPVRFLLARRPGTASALERAFESRLDRLAVGPLTLGAIRRLLSERLGLVLPRRLLRRIVDTTLGNALFALEVGRMLVERGLPAIGEELPVPDAVDDLLGRRVARLPAPARRLLLAVALSADLSTSQLAAIADEAILEDAVDAGLLVVDRDRVRASHPLLAAAARKRSRARARRGLHLELAGVVADGELRARHLALAAAGPDEALATTVAAAAAGAAARGARQEAVELAEHALRLTPPDHQARTDRLLALGDYLVAAGEPQRVTELLAPQLETLPAGAARVRACLILVAGLFRTNDELRGRLERALRESGDDPVLRAAVLAELTLNDVSIEVARIRRAEVTALEAAEVTRRAGLDEDERWALFALGLARILRGRPIDDVRTRFQQVSAAVFEVGSSPERLVAKQLLWRGELERARSLLTGLFAVAEERGEAWSYAWLRLDLCELELRAGRWEEAARMLDEWAESTDREAMPWPQHERCRALLASGEGRSEEAERWAGEAVARATAIGGRWDLLEALRARGLTALLAHEPARAAESLRVVWQHTEREGIDEPGAFPVASALVEALAELGELDEARTITDRLRRSAAEQEHPWGLATAACCDALVRLGSRTDEEEAAAGLAAAAAAYGELGLRFDRARTLLLLGRAQRRCRKWAAARSALEQAAEAFEEIGSPGWLDEVRSELARVGARRPPPAGELSVAERRVADLAAEGLANKEIARALFVSVKTVEAHLSHAYAKLGVRSRAQLVRLLGAG
jgi:DNA-binding CsgD family transcriptional regulator